MSKQYFQGDICIVASSKSQDVEMKPLTSMVVAEGEVTGHKHILSADPKSEVSIGYLSDGRMVMRIVSGSATITHEVHKPITFTPGWYRIVRQREYDELGERRVND